MSSGNESDCRGALQPGLLVRDRAGRRKRITRVEGDLVFWNYVEPTSDSGEPEHSMPYEEFADSHFVLPQQQSPTSGAA